MLASMAVPLNAFAEDPTPATKETKVEYTAEAAYTVTIPAAVELGDTAVRGTIGFSGVRLAKGEKISVVLDDADNKTETSEFNVVQEDNADVSATYTVTDSTKEKTYKLKDEIASFAYDGETTSGTTDIYFTAPVGAAYAGTYKDKLTFKISTGSAAVEATGVTLNQSSFTLLAGQTEKLTATVLPENANDKTVTWASSNESIATVGTDGTVTAVAAGKAVITATTANMKTASCTVTVIANRVVWTGDVLYRSDNDIVEGGVTLSSNGGARIANCFYDRASNTFTAPAGMKFTKIEITCTYSNGFAGGTSEKIGEYYEGEEEDMELIEIYRLTWNGSSSTMTFQNAIYEISEIVFTLAAED
jgi:hypothetical protein